MWRVWRIGLMWLLAVTVPLQGIAAATMVHCRASASASTSADVEGGSAGASAGDAASAHAPAGGAHHHAGPHDAADLSADQPADHTADHTANPPAGSGHSAEHKCSACSFCCVGAAMPSQALAFESVGPAEVFSPPVARRVAAYLNDGLERPPRLFLGL